MQRARNWCWTLNNPTHDEIKFIANLESNNQVNYAVFQLEIGQSGTRHLQGYFELNLQKTISAMKKLLGSNTLHLERRKGTARQAADYCKKSDSRVDEPNQDTQWEWGTISKPGERTDLKRIYKMIKDGANVSDIQELNYSTWCHNYRAIGLSIQARKKIKAGKEDSRAKAYISVFYGPSGSGKSLKVREICKKEGLVLYPVVRGTSSCWYDGIDSSWEGSKFTAMVFDDFYGWEAYDNILRITDRYVTTVQTKGGMVELPLMKRIFFTSNTYPTDWWPNTHTKELVAHGTHLSAFARRIDEIVEMKTKSSEVGGVILDPPTSEISLSFNFGDDWKGQ